jgi:hypothetical protein
MPNQVGGDLLHTMDESKLSRVRTELQSLLIIAFLTPHPVERLTASLRAIATLAMRRSRRMAR